MANLYIAVGKAEVAARLISWADATRKVIGDSRPFLEQADVDRDIATIVSSMGNTAFQEAYDQGSTLTFDEAVVYALPELREQLGRGRNNFPSLIVVVLFMNLEGLTHLWQSCWDYLQTILPFANSSAIF